MRLPLLLLVASLLGCHGDPKPDSDADADADADSDTDADADTDVDRPTGETGDTDPPLDTGPDVSFGTCQEAAAAGPVAAGAYGGDAGVWTADLAPACLDGSTGEEVMWAVELPAYGQLRVRARLTGNDASLAVLETCADTGACAAWADDEGTDRTEVVRLYREAGPTQWTVVLEAGSPVESGDAWAATIDVFTHLPVALEDRCAAARNALPMAPGHYYVGFGGATDNLDMGANSCSGWPSPGPDAMIPVVVPAGATLQLHLYTPGSDGALYLLTDCADPDSCLAGRDGIGEEETLSWTNTGPGRSVFVVLDSYEVAAAPAVGWLSVSLQ